jgi:hypothetical protein
MRLKSGSHRPSVDPSAVIAPNATLVGDVSIGARCVIGCGACLIAEGQPITLGDIVRDNAVIRSTAKYPVEVGNAVLIGPYTALPPFETGAPQREAMRSLPAISSLSLPGGRFRLRSIVRER